MSSERDFPYDPRADVTKLHGLDKLRAVADRGWAAELHKLWVQNEPRWRAEGERGAKDADYGLGGSAVFPDDYSAFDALGPPAPGTAARSEWERTNSQVFHAWEEWLARLEEYKVDYRERSGRELTAGQDAAHRARWAQIMRRHYGIAYPDPKWVELHKAWQVRP